MLTSKPLAYPASDMSFLAPSRSKGSRLLRSGVNPVIPGAIISPVGVDAPRITVRLMVSISIAW